MRFVEPTRDKEQLADLTNFLKEHNEWDFIMWMMGINIGILISEILKLKVKEVKLHTHLKNVEQKTAKYKRVIIPPVLRKKLARYVEGKKPTDFLIFSR